MKRQALPPGKQGPDNPNNGRIQVFLRLRPLRSEDDKDRYGRETLEVADQSMSKIRVVDGKKEKTFQFDRVFPSDASNDEVYRLVGKPLVEAAVTGLSGILIAYGQTGSGKTHTLMSQSGLTTSIVERIFALASTDEEHSYTVSCSYLQIYQEKIHDLLRSSSGPEVFLRQHPQKGVYVHNLTECPVHSADEVMRLLRSGKKKLAVAETKMNRQSSRSHAICQLKVERVSIPRRINGSTNTRSPAVSSDRRGTSHVDWYSSKAESTVDGVSYYNCYEDDELLNNIGNGLSSTKGKLYICDLAGSERIKKTKARGERLQEAQSINSSLLELGNVINALAEGRRHVPFRNSTFTRLLQDGLQGNSRTSLIVCVSPSVRDVNETLCSIKFGLRAMKVSNVAQVNVEVDYEKMARHLAATLEAREHEWTRMKNEYEASITDLQNGKQAARLETHFECEAFRESPNFRQNGCKAEELKNQTKAVLLAELLSMELFYGMDDLLRDSPADTGLALPAEKMYTLTDRELLIHSAETLLELIENYFSNGMLQFENGHHKSRPEVDDLDHHEIGVIMEGRQEITRHSTPVTESTYGKKLLRVKDTLHRLKETTDSAAVKFFSHLFETKMDESEGGSKNHKRKLHQVLQEYVKTQEKTNGREDFTDICDLEKSLCHVLMDKALMNCILLLDKTEMESRLKKVKHSHAKLDYSGFSRISPVEVTCPGHYIDDLSPSPPLFGGRLTSVDEGVVLESSSDSTNSREKLTPTHFENGHMEDLHDKNEELRQKIHEYEKEKSSLKLRVRDLEALLAQSAASSGVGGMPAEWKDERNHLENKIQMGEEVRQTLCTKLKEYQDKLLESASRVSYLSESEQVLRSEVLEKKRTLEKTEEQNTRLNLRLKDLETLENTQLKGSESPLWEGKSDKLRIYEHDNTELNCKIVELERKLQESNVKLASVKEYERRLRAELCKEMTKKLVEAQTRSRELGDTILVLELKIRESTEQYLLARQTDTNIGIISGLRRRLESTERQNKELNNKAQGQQVQLQAAQDIDMTNKEVLSLREKICRLENDALTLKENVASLELENRRLCDEMSETNHKKESASIVGGSLPSKAERKVKTLKLEKASLRSEVQTFRENSLALESRLFVKDQEILSLKNQIVDLKSEECLVDNRSDTENKLSVERKVQSELSLLQKDYKTLKENSGALSADNVCLSSTQMPTKRPFHQGARTSEPSSVIEENMLSNTLQHESQNKEDEEATIHHLEGNITELFQEKEKLEGSIDQLGRENTRLVEENRFFAERSKTMGDRVRRFSEEKESISHECILKNAENETLRTYASLCTDEAKSLKAYLSASQKYVSKLEEKVTKLELEMIATKGDLVSGTCDTELLQEQKTTLEKRIQEASRVLDRVKEELLNLTTGVLTSQKELGSVLDHILIELGAEERCKKVSLRRPMSSIDSNHYSSSLCSDDIGSEMSDVFLSESLLPCVLSLDEECFLNPSEISIVRENKAEILSIHEQLKAKLVIVKDILNYSKTSDTADDGHRSRGFIESRTDPGLQSSSCDSVLSEERRSRKRLPTYTLPALERVEKARLSSLLTSSTTQSKETHRDSQQSVYEAYLELEDQFLQLSKQLVTKEDELFDVLTEKKKLMKTLDDCQKGIVLCDHCAAKDPRSLEESRWMLKARLLSHMEETARLETEMMEVVEYRDKLKAELNINKVQLAAMEDSIVKSAGVVRPERLNSDTDSFSSEEHKPCLPEKKRSAQKRVTFENVQSDVDGRSNIQPSKQTSNVVSETAKNKAGVWQQSDMDGFDVDLCELLSSVSLEVEIKPAKRSEEELEIAQDANRLSAYDNLSYMEKLDFILKQRQRSLSREDDDLVKMKLFDNPSTHRNFSSDANCRMCGLFGTRRTVGSENDTYTKS